LEGCNVEVVCEVLSADGLSDSHFGSAEDLSKSVDEYSTNYQKNQQSGDSTALVFEMRFASKPPPIIVGEQIYFS